MATAIRATVNIEHNRVWFTTVDYGSRGKVMAMNDKYITIKVPAQTYLSGQTRQAAATTTIVFEIVKQSEVTKDGAVHFVLNELLYAEAKADPFANLRKSE